MRRVARPTVLVCRGGLARLAARPTRTITTPNTPSVCIKRSASSSSSSSSSSNQGDNGKRNAWEAIVRPIPVGLGLATIAAIGMYHAMTRDIDEARHPPPLDKFEADIDFDVVAAPTPFTPSSVEMLTLLPLRGISRMWGAINEWEGPKWLMQLVLRTYAKSFGCRLDEMREPSLESFANLQQFFTRRLRDDVRPITPTGMASPVDGRVMSVGVVEDDHHAYQIKGMRYSIPALLGEPLPSVANTLSTAEPATKPTKLVHLVLYLAPGDYHGIHAPVDCSISIRRHVPGHLFPVAPEFVRRVAGLFAVNERVVLSGKWDNDKFFTLTPVGATNVGSITVSFDPTLKTNLTRSKLQRGVMLERYFEQPVELKKGEEVAFFRLGSTVVLVFEAPNDFEFKVKPGQRVKLGQLIGDVSSNTLSNNATAEPASSN